MTGWLLWTMLGRVTTPESKINALCLICREQNEVIEVPGGVFDDGEAITFHRPPLDGPLVYAGHLLVTPRRHVPDFATLDPTEAAAIGIAISKYCGALSRLGATRVYVATIGHRVDHLHVHLLPRWPGTPEAVPWHSVDEWAGARRADASMITELMAAIRD